MKGRRWGSYLSATILAAVSVGAFFLDVSTYEAHMESGWSKLVSIVVIVLGLVGLLKAVARKEKMGALMHACVILLALFLAYWESKIPFCPMCDGVTAEDLGFLSRWISTGP